jgi:hypothetical protein
MGGPSQTGIDETLDSESPGDETIGVTVARLTGNQARVETEAPRDMLSDAKSCS